MAARKSRRASGARHRTQAATSTVAAIRRLGAKNWQRLHRLAYGIGVCAVLHYLWLAKKANPDPYYYAGGLALLLAVRGWDWGRRRLARARVGSVLATGRSVVGGLSVRTTTQNEGR